MDSMKNISLLTDEQIEQRALEIYPVINDNIDPAYRKQDILFEHREIYKSAWSGCTEHYRELIEAGIECMKKKEEMDAQVAELKVEIEKKMQTK